MATPPTTTVTFLGTGSAMPNGERVQTGILVESGDRTVLVDCGSGVLHRLAQTTGYESVSHVLLTHHHLDHVSDLLALLKARWLVGTDSLTVAGPPGTQALVSDLLSVHDYLQDRVDLDVRDVEAGSFSFAGFGVDAMETRHSMQSFAYRLDDRLCYTGDSEAFEELASFADGCSAFVHDCSFPDAVEVSNHPTPSSLGRALAAADPSVDTVYLTHLYPHTDGNHDEMRSSIADHYDGDVEFANDCQQVTI